MVDLARGGSATTLAEMPSTPETQSERSLPLDEERESPANSQSVSDFIQV